MLLKLARSHPFIWLSNTREHFLIKCLGCVILSTCYLIQMNCFYLSHLWKQDFWVVSFIKYFFLSLTCLDFECASIMWAPSSHLPCCGFSFFLCFWLKFRVLCFLWEFWLLRHYGTWLSVSSSYLVANNFG